MFIPCGTTQAMMALAIASGSAWYGGAILFAFILGTAPLFGLLGFFATKLGDTYQKKFFKVAAIAIILLAFYNLKGALTLSGVDFNRTNQSASQTQANSEITITIEPNGYSPKNLTVPAGEKITLHLKNDKAYSCAQAFTIPKLNIQKVVRPGQETTLTFTAPSKPGKLNFSCSMGMYKGVINVI